MRIAKPSNASSKKIGAKRDEAKRLRAAAAAQLAAAKQEIEAMILGSG